MFNENFSFGSPPHEHSLSLKTEQCASSDISPCNSRCSSPRNCRTASPRRDSRFDAYRFAGAPRHPSITALTAQLQSHALDDTEMHSPSLHPSDPGSPTDSASASDVDEGFYDGPDTPATTVSDPYDLDDVDPTLWDLSMSDVMSPGFGHAYRRVPPKFFAIWERSIENLKSQKRVNMRGFRSKWLDHYSQEKSKNEEENPIIENYLRDAGAFMKWNSSKPSRTIHYEQYEEFPNVTRLGQYSVRALTTMCVSPGDQHLDKNGIPPWQHSPDDV
ncbi:hypothetical protein PV05_07004 [Exophiala xenobiotica]|uniref:Uncharacterized protein n=1 Tax=Exophiala xenobiotica TaxID=348802 RepID=A0A0D2BQ41_9EURO|nr:uncharacterized protein PV05_07004 [Exophiala xenobiotica]KIW54656.1 hypothetical protein PV05_07004 [Exophiala xenobiotica]